MVVAIPLKGYGNRFVAYVDDEDLHLVAAFRWRAMKSRSTYYAIRDDDTAFTNSQYMHRLISEPAPGLETDHKDRRGFNNRRSNLRNVTQQLNSMNRGPAPTNKTGLKGVSKWGPGLWRARINIDRKTVDLGVFTDQVEAAKAYDAVAQRLYGECAYLNFPSSKEDARAIT